MRPSSIVDRLACAALLAIALVSVAQWWTTLSMVAGGADSYGYISESRLLLRGALIQRPIEATWLPLDRGQALGVSAPLGYVPSYAADAVVPVYPLGLPAMMAVATAVAGPNGPFFVAPILGLVGLVLVYALARVWFAPLTACAAVALVAWNPLYVAYAKQPMSDVPATVWLLLAIWLVARRPAHPAAAGLAAGIAFLTRPALAGGCALVALGAGWRNGWRAALTYCGVLAIAVVAQMGIHWAFYGHPLQSGYGSASTLFSWSLLPSNTAIYATWTARAHGVIWLAAVALGVVFARPRALVGAAVALLVSVALPYLLYFEFDHWETLRFVLPGLIALTIVAAAGVTAACERLNRPAMTAAVLVAWALGVAYESNRWLEQQGTWRLSAIEEKYPLAARWIASTTPPDAMVMAFQHSGSIRYYADRFTLRWDVLRPAELVPTLQALDARGVKVFAAFEENELARFQDRFNDVLDRVELLPAGQARGVVVVEVRVK